MQEQHQKKIFCKQNIPNILVVVRMVLAVIVVVFLMLNHYSWQLGISNANKLLYWLDAPHWWPSQYVAKITLFLLLAGIIFVIASITDWLDGFLARKNNWVSNFGKFWDPIADKVLINSTLICFAWSGYVFVAIPVIMIARDVITDAAKMVAAKKDVVIVANFWGKAKTVLQMAGIILIFFVFANNGSDITDSFYWTIQQLLLYCATIVSVASGIIYLLDIRKQLNNNAQQN